jgi:hypothetical protein
VSLELFFVLLDLPPFLLELPLEFLDRRDRRRRWLRRRLLRRRCRAYHQACRHGERQQPAA